MVDVGSDRHGSSDCGWQRAAHGILRSLLTMLDGSCTTTVHILPFLKLVVAECLHSGACQKGSGEESRKVEVHRKTASVKDCEMEE